MRKQAAGNAPQYGAEDEDACPQPTGIYSQTDGRILRVPHGAECKAGAATNEILREQHADGDDTEHQIVKAQGRIQYEAEDLQLWNAADPQRATREPIPFEEQGIRDNAHRECRQRQEISAETKYRPAYRQCQRSGDRYPD